MAAAQILSYSDAYIINGFKNPHGENSTHFFAGVQRTLSRGATYLIGTSVASSYGIYHHAKEVISNEDKDIRVKNIVCCLREIIRTAQAVGIIASTLLLVGALVPFAKTLLISGIAVEILTFLGAALYCFYSATQLSPDDFILGDSLQREAAFHHNRWTLIGSGFSCLAPPLSIGVGLAFLKLYFKSWDAIIKPLAVITLLSHINPFLQYTEKSKIKEKD